MKSLIGFVLGFAIAIGFSYIGAYYVYEIDDPKIKKVYVDDSKLDKYATSTFDSIYNLEDTIREDEYAKQVINKLDLILKELYKLNR